MMIRGIAAWLLAMVLLVSAAHAHGGVGMRDNRCVLRIGPDIMFFTGYQPQNSREEFCDDIPSTGQMVVALDMQDTELRDMLTEIRLIKDEGNHTTTGVKRPRDTNQLAKLMVDMPGSVPDSGNSTLLGNDAGSLWRGRRARCAASAPAEIARLSQRGRTRLSGNGGNSAGFGIDGCRRGAHQ